MQKTWELPKIDLHSGEIVELVSKYAPFLTPLAPAAVAVAGLARGMQASYGGFGWLFAVMSGAGMEGTGYLAAYLLMRAIRRGSWSSAAFSLMFLAAYAVFAIMAMNEIPDAGIFQFFVAMSIVCYLVVGQYTYENKLETERRQAEDAERKKREQERADRIANAEAIERENAARAMLIDAERKLENSKIRLAKTTSTPVRVRVPNHEREQAARANALTPEQVANIRAAWQVEGATTRSVAKACGVSSTSADKYKPEGMTK